MAPEDRDRAGGGTSDLGDHGELDPGVCEFGDRNSGLSGGDTGERIEDPLSGLLTGARLVVTVVERGQALQVCLHVRCGEGGEQGLYGRLVRWGRD